MEIKYTSDGKKVAVLGKLNSTDTIVQEIFVINENEIPSGENFIIKSLHDEPAISWKETELKRVKCENERLLIELENSVKSNQERLSKIKKDFKEQSKILSDKFKFIANAIRVADENSFNTLLAFLEGKIKYFLIDETYAPNVVSFSELVEKYSDSDYWSGVNLISLFGNDKGDLQYMVGDYYNGYEKKTHVIPFENEIDAINALKKIIDNQKQYNDYTIEAAKKHGFKLDSEKLDYYIDDKKRSYESSVKSYSQSVETYKVKISEIETLTTLNN